MKLLLLILSPIITFSQVDSVLISGKEYRAARLKLAQYADLEKRAASLNAELSIVRKKLDDCSSEESFKRAIVQMETYRQRIATLEKEKDELNESNKHLRQDVWRLRASVNNYEKRRLDIRREDAKEMRLFGYFMMSGLIVVIILGNTLD